MTPEAWQRVKTVFNTAITLPPDERASFLASVCGTDVALRIEVESLLAAADTEDLPDTPAQHAHSRLRSALAERYRLERELGRGGMATVFLAHDLKHDRPVALKVLHPELAVALGAERFEQEIKLAARLQHPHILSVHDSGESAGQLWFTMPFVEGESLRDRLDREMQLPVEDALRITREVAGALDYAHRHGVVHRDVKPENILLTETHALVADFGIARTLGRAQHQLTEPGVAMGTLAYMSPEQASGTQEVDARTDVYALGCVLFEMLAGEAPYTGTTPQAVRARAMTERPRPIHPMRPSVPEALDAVIAKAMTGIPADRYSSAAQLARALELVAKASEHGSAVDALAERNWHLDLPPSVRKLLAGAGITLLLTGSGFFAWQLTHRSGPGKAQLVAVLPFDNYGGREGDYFADGVADGVRGKLVAVPGLQVVASGSANHYKRTAKSPSEIAQDLGAQYLLYGKVRWQQAPGSAAQVQVTIELVQTTPGPPTTIWQAPFEAALTNAFLVQGEIATRVAQALGFVLSDSVRRRLAEPPTHDFAAYDAYLRGQEESQDLSTTHPGALRRATQHYARATVLDSNFFEAWAALSRMHTGLYFNATPSSAVAAQARRAAERALVLKPNRPEGHAAIAAYYLYAAKDYARASEALRQGLRLTPDDPDLLTASAELELANGDRDVAVALLQRARRVDPRSVRIARDLTETLTRLRRYQQAHEAAKVLAALDPTNLDGIEDRAIIFLAQGDLAGARSVITSVPPEVEQSELVAFFGNYWDLCWVLDEPRQRLLLSLTPSAFDGNRGTWGIVLAQAHWLRGDLVGARVYAESARVAFEAGLRSTPQDAQFHALLGLALAYLGSTDRAIQEGIQGVAYLPVSKNAFLGSYIQHQLVRIFLIAGESEKALDYLEPLLKTPYHLSREWLRIDPNFDPLHDNPRFQRLVAGGG